jgi:hypothetical protein
MGIFYAVLPAILTEKGEGFKTWRTTQASPKQPPIAANMRQQEQTANYCTVKIRQEL